MQTPCRKTPGWELNPGPSCCKATVLTTVPQCSPGCDKGLPYITTCVQFWLNAASTSTRYSHVFMSRGRGTLTAAYFEILTCAHGVCDWTRKRAFKVENVFIFYLVLCFL
ncbi:hypothetical protein CRENBAI_024432 [Crenichthys baileyi]|uniref:Uncharacterized protein n=1 Tax=Crenichthys baileyi TaxID=28760 RepID=A0AAV9QRE8_9TELE